MTTLQEVLAMDDVNEIINYRYQYLLEKEYIDCLINKLENEPSDFKMRHCTKMLFLKLADFMATDMTKDMYNYIFTLPLKNPYIKWYKYDVNDVNFDRKIRDTMYKILTHLYDDKEWVMNRIKDNTLDCIDDISERVKSDEEVKNALANYTPLKI